MRKTLTAMLTGALLGAALLGGAQAVGETVTAQRSTQRVYVDGEQVQMEAYAIGGANYVKLRDAGEAVGFNVYWDGSAVQVQSDAPYTGEAPAPRRETGSRIVTLPTDGSKYVPKAGDVIRCDDGYLYEIKDTLRWENNVFSPEPLPELPTPSYDWSVFPALELPPVDCRRFQSEYGDDLYVRNLHETLRMAYTVYEAVRNEPEAWRDGKPLTKVSLTIDPADEPYTKYFLPWREGELLKHVRAFPRFHFRVEAWDFYHNHTFLQTQYYVFIG